MVEEAEELNWWRYWALGDIEYELTKVREVERSPDGAKMSNQSVQSVARSREARVGEKWDRKVRKRGSGSFVAPVLKVISREVP